jgi:hypothetical protein
MPKLNAAEVPLSGDFPDIFLLSEPRPFCSCYNSHYYNQNWSYYVNENEYLKS